MKKNIERFLYFLVYSNIYLAVGAACITTSFLILLNAPFDLMAPFVYFSLVFFLYTINRYTDKLEDKINYPSRLEFFRRYGKYILIFSSLLFIFSLVLLFSVNLNSFFIFLVPFILVLFYSVFRLKKIFFMKNIIVATGWATIPFFIFAQSHFLLSIYAVFTLFLFLFFRVLLGSIFFDIKDVTGDKIYKIRTIPSRWGIKKTKYVLHSFNFIASFVLILGYLLQYLNALVILPSLIMIYTFFCIQLIGKFDIRTLCDLLVDGDGIILLMLVLASVLIW